MRHASTGIIYALKRIILIHHGVILPRSAQPPLMVMRIAS
jgi:hypothetical protein